MNFSEAIGQLSILSNKNSETLIKLSEIIGKQNTKISELEKEIKQLKSKLK